MIAPGCRTAPPGDKGLRMPEPLDARLCDDTAMAEIEMTSALIIAASDATSQLPPAEINRSLGVDQHENANSAQVRSAHRPEPGIGHAVTCRSCRPARPSPRSS